MQVFLQQNLQHEQVQTVLNSIKDKYSNITLFAKDKEIDLNRLHPLINSQLSLTLNSIQGSVIVKQPISQVITRKLASFCLSIRIPHPSLN